MADTLPVLERWLFDPTAGRIMTIAIGIVIIAVIVRLAHRAAAGYLQDNATRYQARKAVTFAGYGAGGLLLALVFSDRLGGLTVAFGVAGAGVATPARAGPDM
jgi:glucose uptake protein GlcU